MTRQQSMSNHFHPLQYKLLWVLVIICAVVSLCAVSAIVFYTSTYNDQIRGLEERMGKTERGTTGQQKRVGDLEELLANMTSALEDRAEGHLEDVNRKASANDLAIESLRYDLNKDINLRLTGLEVKTQEDSKSLHDTIEGLEATVRQLEATVEQLEDTVEQLEDTVEQLEATVEQLNIDVKELKSGFTKQIDDIVRKVTNYFNPPMISGLMVN